jgi:ABC-type dipeptide/oligopeptide/nickel transport system permease component
MGRLITSLALSTVFAEMSFGVTGFGAIFAEALKSGDLRLMQGWILMVGGCVAVMHRDS